MLLIDGRCADALRNMEISPPEYVAIQGIGYVIYSFLLSHRRVAHWYHIDRGLGHLAIQFASAMGYRTIALSSDSSKEELSRALGADEFIDSSKVDQAQALQEFGGMKVIMSTAPNAGITESLIDALAVNGTLLVMAVEPEPMKISPCECIW